MWYIIIIISDVVSIGICSSLRRRCYPKKGPKSGRQGRQAEAATELSSVNKQIIIFLRLSVARFLSVPSRSVTNTRCVDLCLSVAALCAVVVIETRSRQLVICLRRISTTSHPAAAVFGVEFGSVWCWAAAAPPPAAPTIKL